MVLVFYPADFSPVCTDQLNVYQEVLGELEERGAQLLGISVDGAFCHKAFQEQLEPDDPAAGRLPPQGRGGQGLRRLVRGVRRRRARARDGRPRRHASSGRTCRPPLEVPGANLIFDALEQRTAA